MRDSFEPSFNMTVLKFEGGSRYTNDPTDPGGETRWGLSKRANPDLDIANITMNAAKEVYLERYWKPAGCDEMPYPWDAITFDTAVNMGVKKALKIKEGAATPADCHLQRIFEYCRIVENNPVMAKYIKGWVNRVVQLWQVTK